MAYPNLSSILPKRAADAIRELYDRTAAALERVGKVEGAGYLTADQAAKQFGAAALKAALQVGGRTALNVTGLIGRLANPQYPYVQFVTSIPGFADPLSQNGNLISLNGVVYRFDGTSDPGRWLPLGAIAVLLEDTHANRLANYPAVDYPLNTVFYETDRTVFYHVQSVVGVKTWVYLFGTMVNTLANIPGDLSTPGAGFLFMVSDYNHLLKWSGSAWAWAPGDDKSGYFRHSTLDPGTGWQLCNGSTVNRLNSDASVTSVTVPDLSGDVFLRGAGSYTGAVNSAGTAKANGETDPASAGSATGTTGLPSSAQAFSDVGGGTPLQAASDSHTHDFTSAALPDHEHDLTDVPVTFTDDPVNNLDVLIYYRR